MALDQAVCPHGQTPNRTAMSSNSFCPRGQTCPRRRTRGRSRSIVVPVVPKRARAAPWRHHRRIEVLAKHRNPCSRSDSPASERNCSGWRTADSSLAFRLRRSVEFWRSLERSSPRSRVVKRSQRARTSLSGDNPTRSGAPRYHVSAPSLTRFGSSPARSPCNLLRS
jgi:hypothetical protein